MSKELNSERLRDKSDKLHWLHEYLLDTYRFVCRSIFSNKNLIHFTTSGIRKVPDHLDGGQDRFISRLESGEPDHHCRRRLRLYRRLVVLVKGEIRGRKRRERERERERTRSTGWCESQSYRQRYKCPAEAALMKQMHSRYMQLERSKI